MSTAMPISTLITDIGLNEYETVGPAATTKILASSVSNAKYLTPNSENFKMH